MDAEGAICHVAHFGHVGRVSGNKMCIIMNEFFYYTNVIR